VVAKVLTVKLLQEMAQDIARLLLQRFKAEDEQVEINLTAERMDGGVRVDLKGMLPSGEVLFAIQSDLYSAWLEEPIELSQKITLYRA